MAAARRALLEHLDEPDLAPQDTTPSPAQGAAALGGPAAARARYIPE